MPRTRPPYPPEFREQILELIKIGRSPEELAQEFEPTAQTIRNWMKQAELGVSDQPEVLSGAEQEELKRLRRENKRLRQEREILAKAAAWFARETDAVPPKSSRS